ncbi:peptide-binding protein [Methylocystis bryophila]|nr:peptide-binding protein [Methylocystis bryophila]
MAAKKTQSRYKSGEPDLSGRNVLMPSFRRLLTPLVTLLCLVVLAAAAKPRTPSADKSRTPAADKLPANALRFELDAGRILVAASFRTPDGGTRRALAWFNMGMQAPILTKGLYAELGIGAGQPMRLLIGAAEIEANPKSVRDDGDSTDFFAFPQYFGPHKVEAMLPASLFLNYRLTLNYQTRTLSLESAEGRPPQGTEVPFALNPETGLAAVDVSVDGRSYPFVIDAGSGFSWMRGSVLSPWLAAHPDWRRADGAMGAANYNMLDFNFEKRGTVARIPSIRLGALEIKDVGVLGSAPYLAGWVDVLTGDLFWDKWQKSAPGPVVGWLGANVLERYALTLDYPNRISYWRALSGPDTRDLDSVALTLVRKDARYIVGGLPKAGDQPPTEGVEVGDELVAVGQLAATGAPRGAVLAALHGKPGDKRRLTFSRGGAVREVELPIIDMH